MSAPREINELIDRFARNTDSYRSNQYNETQVRREFIDPFFKCLGWDIDNRLGFAEAYKDVIHEDAIKIAGHTKAPDYCFRIGGTRKFFLEAKRPGVNLKADPVPAFQLRRYAWSAKLPLSILTDFEEFVVYDCRIKPAQTDKASVGRVRYLTFTEYTEHWDSIAATFSKDAVLKGSFDKYAETSKLKKGTATVDAAFLKEIESWRELLARNIALRNGLSQRELNYAVQVTIDRILFLRMCEDRGIEPYGQLDALQNGAAVYGRLKQLFRKADDRYNSGLFHFEKDRDRPEPPDELTPALVIDDKPLKEIFKHLYYPDSPYEFSVLPAEILGQVYEQFLGKVIRLSGSHRAVVEEKPEVRKAGGVYYTPTYIVDYIVKNTVGKLLGEPGGASPRMTPRQASKLKILDPACGSGSFLLGAYQYLLDWHRERYLEEGTAKHSKELYQGRGGAWHLTSGEKKRILLNNIFGVDIDAQAVEVTKLSLLLKVLEGESQQTLERQLLLFHERALPDLANNIKCGNSLIGPDFYDGQQLLDFGEEERYRINVFDWNAEFPAIMKAGGFDAVIGNPPYGADYDGLQKVYFQSSYIYKEGKPETYIFFMDKSVSLLRKSGILGFITPNAWLTNHYGVQLRRYLLENTVFENLVDLEPTKVFGGAVVDTAITILSRTQEGRSGSKTSVCQGTRDRRIVQRFTMDQTLWWKHEQAVVNLQANPTEVLLLAKLEKSESTLDDLVEYSQGTIPYESKAEGAANRYIAQESRKGWLPLLENASQVRRYEVDEPQAFIHYGPWLCRPREQRFFSGPKILFHRLRKKLAIQLIGALDESGAINRHALSILILRPGRTKDELSAVLGLFNSKLANWWFVKTYGVLMEVGGFKLNRLPLPQSWAHRRDRMVEVVQQMLALHKKKLAAKTPHEKKTLETQIATTDRQIDALVYELYGLTPEEITIVEQTANESATSDPVAVQSPNEENGENKEYTPYQPAIDAGITKEMDRVNFQRIQLIERKARGTLTADEEKELERLQDEFFAYVETKFPRSRILNDDRLEKLEQKYKEAERT